MLWRIYWRFFLSQRATSSHCAASFHTSPLLFDREGTLANITWGCDGLERAGLPEPVGGPQHAGQSTDAIRMADGTICGN